MNGPERRQDIVVGLDVDERQAIVQAMSAQGCTCGDAIRVESRPLTAAERERWEDAEHKQAFDVRHLAGCPFVAGYGSGGELMTFVMGRPLPPVPPTLAEMHAQHVRARREARRVDFEAAAARIISEITEPYAWGGGHSTRCRSSLLITRPYDWDVDGI